MKKKGFIGLVIAVVMAVTLIGGCLMVFAAGVNPLIEKVAAKPGQNTATAHVSIETQGEVADDYFINVYDGEEYIGTTETKFTETGDYTINLFDERIFEFEKTYIAKLFVSKEGEASQPVEVYKCEFQPQGAIIQHIEARPCTSKGKVVIAGLTDGQRYFVTIYKEGSDEYIGTTENIVSDGAADVYLQDGRTFEPQGKYVAKLSKRLEGQDSKSEEVYKLPFNPEGVVMEHVEAVEGYKEFVIQVSGVKEAQEWFIEIFKDGQMVGQTENIVTNGPQTAYMTEEALQAGVLYEAQLFAKDGSQSEYIYSLTFDAKAGTVPKTGDAGNTALWIVIAALGIAGLGIAGKKVLQK